MVYLNQIERDFKVSYRHSPREFHTGSFWTDIEIINGKEQIILWGITKRNHKNPGQKRKVATLKPRHKREYYTNIFGERVMR